MTDRQLPSPELVCKLVRYEPDTGKLFWLPRPREFFKTDRHWKAWNVKHKHKECFVTPCSLGYMRGRIFRSSHAAHRVAWAIQTGKWPADQIDHIDRNPSNNVWSNLREATQSQNMANSRSKAGSSSQYLGVSWSKKDKRWIVKIKKDNVVTKLGYFRCEVEAAKAYDVAARQIHGEFANLNLEGSV